MFLDRSTLNVGENSDLVIDEFVYKPDSGGTMSASVTKGVVRFVGGDISHGGGASIRTPVATVGIRGGIGTIGFVEDGASLSKIPGIPADFHGGTIVVNGYGTLSVSNAAGTVELSRPGFAVFVGSGSGAIPTPVRLDIGAAQTMMKALTSAQGQHGGAAPKVAASLTGGAALPSLPAHGHLMDAPPAPPRVPSVNAIQFTSIFSSGNSFARSQAQARSTTQLAQTIQSAPNSLVITPNGVVVTGTPPSGASANQATAVAAIAAPSGTGGTGSPFNLFAFITYELRTAVAVAEYESHHNGHSWP